MTETLKNWTQSPRLVSRFARIDRGESVILLPMTPGKAAGSAALFATAGEAVAAAVAAATAATAGAALGTGDAGRGVGGGVRCFGDGHVRWPIGALVGVRSFSSLAWLPPPLPGRSSRRLRTFGTPGDKISPSDRSDEALRFDEAVDASPVLGREPGVASEAAETGEDAVLLTAGDSAKAAAEDAAAALVCTNIGRADVADEDADVARRSCICIKPAVVMTALAGLNAEPAPNKSRLRSETRESARKEQRIAPTGAEKTRGAG